MENYRVIVKGHIDCETHMTVSADSWDEAQQKARKRARKVGRSNWSIIPAGGSRPTFHGIPADFGVVETVELAPPKPISPLARVSQIGQDVLLFLIARRENLQEMGKDTDVLDSYVQSGWIARTAQIAKDGVEAALDELLGLGYVEKRARKLWRLAPAGQEAAKLHMAAL